MIESLMLNIIIVLVCLVFLIINKKNKCQISSIVQLQNIVWLIAFLIYLTGIIDYYPLDISVYICSLGYLISFNLAYISKGFTNEFKSSDISFIKSICDKKKSNKCIVASIISWILAFGIFQKTIPIFIEYGFSVGMNVLRYKTYGELTIFTTFELMLITYIIRPIFVVTILLLAQQISIKKSNFKLLLVAVIDAFILVLMTAARSMMITLVLYIFSAILYVNGTNIFKFFKQYKKYFIPGITLLIVIIIVSSQRINRDNGFITEFMLYFFSGIPFFSQMMKSAIVPAYSLLGRGLFSIILDLPILLMRYMGFDVVAASQTVSNITNPSLIIGNDIGTNATASTLLPFYMDFGYFGPIIAGFILGKFVVYCEKKFNNDLSCYNYGVYIYLMGCFFASIQNYALLGFAPFMTFVFMYILLKDSGKKIVLKK